MKTVLWHGMGQRAEDWKAVIEQTKDNDFDCPELFSQAEGAITYHHLLQGLSERYADRTEPFRICGLSLGAMLAMDYCLQNIEKVSALVLIGAQYRSPRFLMDCQNLVFRCMPSRAFQSAGLSKSDMLRLSRSMRKLNFRERLCEITCPVAVVCGEKDHANIRTAKKLASLLPQATLHIVPGAGHEVNKDAPEQVADILNFHRIE